MLNLGYKVSSTVWPHESSRAWDQTTGALHAGGMNWEPIHGSHWLSSFSIHNLNQIHVVVLSSDHGSQVEGANWIKLDQISYFFGGQNLKKPVLEMSLSHPNYPRFPPTKQPQCGTKPMSMLRILQTHGSQGTLR